MATNATIETLLNRRSIRKFKDEPIDDDATATLETVAQHAASSQFLNDWSAIRVSDPAIKARLAEIGNQPYIATAPLLYVSSSTSIATRVSPNARALTRPLTNSISSTAIASLRPRTTPCWLCTPWRPRPTRWVSAA